MEITQICDTKMKPAIVWSIQVSNDSENKEENWKDESIMFAPSLLNIPVSFSYCL